MILPTIKFKRTAKMTYDTAERPVQAELWENTGSGERLNYHLIQRYDEYNQPSKLTERVLVDQTGGEIRGIYATEVGYDVESRPTEVKYSAHIEGEQTEKKEGKVAYSPSAGKYTDALHKNASNQYVPVSAKFASSRDVIPTEQPSARALRYGYDKLGRISSRELFADPAAEQPVLRTELSYWMSGAQVTAPLVTGITQAGRTLTYAYDAVGNITAVMEEGGETPDYSPVTDEHGHAVRLQGQPNDPLTALPTKPPYPLASAVTRYAYDKLGQLIRVNDERAKETWTYEYDQGGNILKKQRFDYTTGTPGTALETVTYAYDDANWKDKLSSYTVKVGSNTAVTKSITYDKIGNPTAYDGWEYTWKAGRMLESMKKGKDIDASFTYDHTGLRVQKVVNGVTTSYIMNGKKITHAQKGSVRMHFFYDAQGRPSLIRYNGVDYAYLHNLQGDVVGMIDMYGARVVEYTYDAWGKPQRTIGGLASTLGKDNPFRYRGYVYDEETGLYYLRSRYYDPQWGRFLNADMYLGKVCAVLNHNMFTYCNNSVIRNKDHDGFAEQEVVTVEIEAQHLTATFLMNNGVVTYFYVDTEEAKRFVSTVAAEGMECNEAERKAIANTIKNRVGEKTSEWTHSDTYTGILTKSQFRGIGNGEYKKCMEYLNDRTGENELYETLITQVMPIYCNMEGDNSNGATHYYRPTRRTSYYDKNGHIHFGKSKYSGNNNYTRVMIGGLGWLDTIHIFFRYQKQ